MESSKVLNKPLFLEMAEINYVAARKTIQFLNEDIMYWGVSAIYLFCSECDNLKYYFSRIPVDKFLEEIIVENREFNEQALEENLKKTNVNHYTYYKYKLRALIVFKTFLEQILDPNFTHNLDPKQIK